MQLFVAMLQNGTVTKCNHSVALQQIVAAKSKKKALGGAL